MSFTLCLKQVSRSFVVFFLAAPMPLCFISAYWYSILLKSVTINVHLYQICICVRLHCIHECVWSLMDVMRCSQMCFFLMDRLQNTLIFYKFFSETRESCLEYLLHWLLKSHSCKLNSDMIYSLHFVLLSMKLWIFYFFLFLFLLDNLFYCFRDNGDTPV